MSISVDNDIFINIIRRKEKIIFNAALEEKAVGIEYIKNDSINSLYNLKIIDTSNNINPNKIQLDTDYVTIQNVIEYVLPTDQFLLTDIFVSDYITNTSVALFYKHIIGESIIARTTVDNEEVIDSNYTLLSVKILDQYFTDIGMHNTQIDYDTGIIYNNLTSTVNLTNNISSVYYIYYTVSISGSTYTYIELLNNSPIFNAASFDDYDDQMHLYPNHKVYSLQEQESYFLIILPYLGTYALKILPEAKLYLKVSKNLDNTQPWNIGINNGKFFANINNNSYLYYIPEYLTQLWNPQYPYKYIELETSSIISENLILLNKQNLIFDSDNNLHINVLIYDEEENGIAAFTTDSSLSGTTASNGATYSYWTITNRIGIRSFDCLNGLLDIDGYKLDSSYIVKTNYYYEEKDYSINSIDFNPLHNLDITNQTIVFFIEPQLSGSYITQSVYYLIVNKSGQIIQSNWPLFDNENQVYLGRTIDTTLTFSYGGDTEIVTTSGYPPLFYKEIPQWAQVYVGGQYYSWQETFWPLTLNYPDSGKTLLVLGEVLITDNTSPKQSWMLDIRNRGGGIAENQIDDLKLINPEVNYYWDIGNYDGTFYPGNGAFYIEVPVTLLNGAGGNFNGAQVREIIDKHIGLGIYPVIRAYGIDYKIDTVTTTDTTIQLDWNFYGTKI